MREVGVVKEPNLVSNNVTATNSMAENFEINYRRQHAKI